MGSLDEWMESVRKCQLLPERDMKHLCEYVQELLLEESTCQPVSAPVTICGDIHGQFHDLLELFRTGGECPISKYIFMVRASDGPTREPRCASAPARSRRRCANARQGDFVDRGYNSLETMTLLILIKARYPHRITLLRGNHESRQVSQVYGFYDECLRKYGNHVRANGEPHTAAARCVVGGVAERTVARRRWQNVWSYCTQVFDAMPLAALVEGRVLCVHGGLSPDVRTCDQMRTITRTAEIPQEGPFADLMWSDPDDIDTWQVCTPCTPCRSEPASARSLAPHATGEGGGTMHARCCRIARSGRAVYSGSVRGQRRTRRQAPVAATSLAATPSPPC
jgi:diadenosine tetraphosphatase ApaH/serine/threonine PP2A family protein phosphatase